jgi:MFS family permease
VQIATYASFFNITPLLPEVGTDLGLDAGALGALIGVGGIVALLVQLPAGSGGDTYGRGPFFAFGMLLALLALGLRWQAQSALALLLAHIAAGASLGIVSTNAFALMAGAAQQGSAFGIVNASISVGQVVGYLIAGTFGVWLGWRGMSVAMASVPLIVLIVVQSALGQRLPACAWASRSDRLLGRRWPERCWPAQASSPPGSPSPGACCSASSCTASRRASPDQTRSSVPPR